MFMYRQQNAGQNHNVKVVIKYLENLAKLRYSGITVSNTNLIQEEIKSWIEVLMAVTMKNTVIYVITPYSLERSERFGGTSPPFSGPKNKPSKKPAEGGGKLRFFDFEDGADMVLRNVWLSQLRSVTTEKTAFFKLRAD
jgi:hypothetical protein